MAQCVLLLVEPNSLFRRTVAQVARELQLADIREASTLDAAQRMLENRSVDALMLDIGEGMDALGLVQNVRSGALSCPKRLPIALTAESCDLATIALYKDLDVRRIMLKPFKVKTVLEVIQNLAAAPAK